ncbi:MAG: hypothetical protein ACK5JR_13565 [Tropicimonas sp.]|uniref:hypothetical protein n=1 Tax=Tropicimonas sp. TaxID=2067044 RepID=UPI003A8A0A6E
MADRLLARMLAIGEAAFVVGAGGELLGFAATARRRASVTSPASGPFLCCGDDDGLAAPALGAEVAAGAVLGYLGNGAVRIPVSAPAAGRITDGGPPAGTCLRQGDILFTLDIPT